MLLGLGLSNLMTACFPTMECLCLSRHFDLGWSLSVSGSKYCVPCLIENETLRVLGVQMASFKSVFVLLQYVLALCCPYYSPIGGWVN